MLVIKVRLLAGIVGLIFDFVARVLKYLYKLLKLFHLRLLFTICAAGAFAELFFSLLSDNATYLIVFLTLISVAGVRFIYIVFFAAVQRQKPQRREKKAVLPPEYEEPSSPRPQTLRPQPKNKTAAFFNRPKYYRVIQNPQYLMAEYPDRYELYYQTENGLKHIRTDFKHEEGFTEYGDKNLF